VKQWSAAATASGTAVLAFKLFVEVRVRVRVRVGSLRTFCADAKVASEGGEEILISNDGRDLSKLWESDVR
jgi:hypothetical protein